MMKTKALNFLLLFLYGFIASCAPILLGPTEPNSSLVIGRVVVDNKYRGDFYGVLPLGIVDKGLEIEIESRDGSQLFNVTTEEQGYFFVPNIPPSTYYIRRVAFEGSSGSRGREKRGQEVRRLIFTPVPGKIGYIGTLMVDISERGFATLKELREDESAKSNFFQKHAGSPWALREFVVVGPRPTPSAQVAQEKTAPRPEQPRVEAKPIIRPGLKAEKPEWKVGYEWRYSWRGPKGSGTLTREVIREDNLGGVPSFVVRAEGSEHFYTKDVLGLLASMTKGRLTFKRDVPRQNLSWPLEVDKEWRNTFLLENVENKSSRTVDLRMSVAHVEEMKVPAGAFEAFKIEVYQVPAGNLVAEYWYSSKAKWFVKQREYLQGGLREEELVSLKVD